MLFPAHGAFCYTFWTAGHIRCSGIILYFSLKSFIVAFSSTFQLCVREAVLPSAEPALGRGHLDRNLFGDQCCFRWTTRFAIRSRLLVAYVVRESLYIFSRKSLFTAFSSRFKLLVREPVLPPAQSAAGCGHLGCNLFGDQCYVSGILRALLYFLNCWSHMLFGDHVIFSRKLFFLAFPTTFQLFVREAVLPPALPAAGRGHLGRNLFGDRCCFRWTTRFAIRSKLLVAYVVRGSHYIYPSNYFS